MNTSLNHPLAWRPTIGVLAVQGGVAEHAHMLETLGARPVIVRRSAHVAGLDGIIMPGGESTTMSRLLSISGMIEPLREAIANGLPAFGTCAGLILLASKVLDTREDAHCLGALDITVRRNAFGRQKDSFETSLDFAGIAQPVDAVFIRAPQVVEIGSEIEVLSRVGSGTIVAVRQGTVMGTSFHPELTQDTRVHQFFLHIVEDARRGGVG